MNRHLLFFDDFPLEIENQIFVLNLRKAFRDLPFEIQQIKTIPRLEAALRSQAFAAIILDIMAAYPDSPEREALAGIEVLKRCRAGEYGPLNAKALFYMRTARGELYVRDLALKLGSEGYFRPGSDDEELIAELRHR